MNLVIKYLDEALGEIDAMDSLISSYKIHLNVGNRYTTTILVLTSLKGCRR